MPPGKTRAPWVLTIESAHWGEDNGVPSEITQAILAKGWAAVHPHHHLAPPNKIAGQVGNGQYPQQTDDVKMAVAAAKRDPRCDGRVGAIGGSGGGNLAAFLQAQGLVFAAVEFSPATYLPDLIVAGGYAAEKAVNYAPTNTAQVAASPLTYLQAGVSTPAMLVAFQTDAMPMNQYTDYDKGLVDAGIEHQSILLPGNGHSWAARSKVDWIGFLAAHLPPLGPPSPSPSSSPSASPTPSATASPGPSSTPARALHGVIELIAKGDRVTGNESGWTRAAIAGMRFRGKWDDAEPIDGQPDYTRLDAFIAAAKAHPDKLTGLSYRGGEAFPAWLKDAGAKFFTFSGKEIALPWDPIVAQKWTEFIGLVLAHCREKKFTPDYVVVGNMGKGLTTEMAETPEEIAAIEAAGGLPYWSTNGDAMIKLYLGFGCKIIVAAAEAPYQTTDPIGKAASGALQALVDRNAALYPQFGPMHTALKAKVGKSGLPYALLTQYSTTEHPTGLQFINSVTAAFAGGPAVCTPMIPTCFADAMAVGASYKVNFIEIYPEDDTDENQATIAATAAKLR
jgi:dienelactone hydrolase